jgi:hypothetical protein
MAKLLGRAFVAGVLTLLPLIASAHERQVFRIGGRAYTFVVGFLNEPVFAGDKSGVDLRIRLADPKDPLNFSSPNLKPVEKLETFLKVEISAEGRKKVFGLELVFRDPGAYRATFFPTAATSYRFRVFGELNGTPVDLAFTCSADGHPRSEEDRSEAKLSDRVTRIFQAGAFGCPRPREAVEFP